MERPWFLERIQRAFDVGPVVALLGPRQCGKTTLARQYVRGFEAEFPERLNYFDLEDPADLNRLEEPKLALEGLRGLVVIDEVQRRPELFPVLRTLVDREQSPARFLVLGSASRDLLNQSSETLAGRISFVDVTPFAAREIPRDSIERLWVRGGFPRSFLAPSDEVSGAWREAFVRTFLERDIPALGIQVPPMTIRRFWQMLVHYHGQIFNASEIGSSLGVSDTTAGRYLDVLVGTFMIRRLPPWHENIGKRQVKRPKIYFRDTGILHWLLGVGSREKLLVHPRLGASWEGFALEEVTRLLAAREEEVYFWGIHQQAELDLLVVARGKKFGFEFKYNDAPRVTRSIEKARDLLHLDALTIVCPGRHDYALAGGVRVKGLETMVAELA